MRVLILGAGAVGGYFGARLAEGGCAPTFLVRDAGQAARLNDQGITLRSPLGDIVASVSAVTDAERYPSADIVVLSCKAFDLPGAIANVRPAVTAGTAILPFLNGTVHLETLTTAFPEARVWGGLAHLSAISSRPGQIRHMNEDNLFQFGPVDGCPGDQATQLASTLSATPLSAEIRRDIVHAMWEKFVFLTTLAGITCLMRGRIGDILELPSGEAYILGLLEECMAVASREGYPIDADSFASYRSNLTEQGSPLSASMLRDVEAVKPTECTHIVGDMCRRAQRHELSAPLLNMAYAHLLTYEARRRKAPHSLPRAARLS